MDFPVRSVISSYRRQGLGRAAAWTFAGPNGLRSSSTDAPGEEWGLDGAEPGPGEVPGAEIAARAQVQPGRRRDGDPPALAVDWQEYAPTIERWEAILGRAAPRPVRPARVTRRRIRACAAANGTDGWAAAEMVRRGWWGAQLSAEFSQWMLGLPPGWVTDVPGLSRAGKLHILGNSVVPRQAAEAVDACLDDLAGVLARPGGEELQCLSAAVS